jgi:hypothetical protein
MLYRNAHFFSTYLHANLCGEVYEMDEALKEYIGLGNDDADMRLSSHNAEAAAEDTEVVTRCIKVKHTCTLNF